jgi:hypothetical protein
VEKQTQAKPSWILIIVGMLLIIYGILCYTTIVPNGFHKEFGFVFVGLGLAAIFWGTYISRTKKKVLLTEKLTVVEEAGVLRRGLGAIVSGSLFLAFFVGTLLFLGPNPETTWIDGQPYVFGGTVPVILAIFLIIGGSIISAFLVGMAILLIGRHKVAVTPILAVSEKNPTIYDETAGTMILAYNFGIIFGGIIKSLAGRSNFILSEEGIVFFRPTGLTLVRWKKFKSYSANRETSEFTLKRGMARISLTSQQQFAEVNKILSDHINTS